MRIPGRAILTASTLALAAGLLAGCTHSQADADPTKPPKPSLTPTPIFTSDADALAAATKVYKEFLAASDLVGHDGGIDPDRVKPYATPEVLDAERRQAQKLQAAHARSYGESKVSNSQLQSVTQHGATVTISIYACEDLSAVDVRDDSGKSLIDPSRADLVAYVVQVRGDSLDHLVVASNKFWSGGGVCSS